MAVTTEPDIMHDAQVAEQEYRKFAQSARELQAKADAGTITDAELDELVKTERRLPGAEQRWHDAEVKRSKAQVAVDVEQLIADWGDGAKRALYEQFVEHLRLAREDLVAILAVTAGQGVRFAKLPMTTDVKPFELDEGALLLNLASRMPDGKAWNMLLNSPTGMLRLPQVEDLVDVDRGAQPLTRRTFRKVLGER
jgi:hypothetical protein